MHSILEIQGTNNTLVKGNKWVIDDTPKKSVVIVHGMAEYSFRYNAFAEFLNENGYDVFALDHLGHGLNIKDPSEIMVWPKDGFVQCVENVRILIETLQKEGREVVVFAHSMGSFMGQMLIETYPKLIKKIILCGTGGPDPLGGIEKLIIKTYSLFTGKGTKKAPIINKIAFGTFNNKVKNKRTDLDWLSESNENVDNYIKDPYCGGIPSKNFFTSFIPKRIDVPKKKNVKKIDPSIRVLLIAGSDDPVGAYTKTIKKLQILYTKHKINTVFIQYKNKRHEIMNEDNKEQVYKDVLRFLNERDY